MREGLAARIDPLSGWPRQADGRTRREVSAALRELLGALDGERCRFPGCTRTRSLHAHHVVHWRDGGPTDLANLVLVCSATTPLLHSQGFQLVLHPDRRLEITTADGVPVLAHRPALGDPTRAGRGLWTTRFRGNTAPDHCDSRLDLHYAVSVRLSQAA